MSDSAFATFSPDSSVIGQHCALRRRPFLCIYRTVGREGRWSRRSAQPELFCKQLPLPRVTTERKRQRRCQVSSTLLIASNLSSLPVRRDVCDRHRSAFTYITIYSRLYLTFWFNYNRLSREDARNRTGESKWRNSLLLQRHRADPRARVEPQRPPRRRQNEI